MTTDARRVNGTLWFRDDDALQCLVLLVEDYEVPADELAKLKDAEAAAIENYCAKAHLRASDNRVRLPERPLRLDQWQRMYGKGKVGG